MFAEIQIAEHLLKNKEKLYASGSIAELDKLWASFPESSSQHKKAQEQMKNCTKSDSLYVCRMTPSIEKFYKLGHILGAPGQYGMCKEAVCIDESSKHYNEKFAVKIINKRKYNDRRMTHEFFQELRAETQLLYAAHDHPNIVNYYHAFEDLNHLYIVMTHCGGGELFDQISNDQKFSEKKAAKVFKQMMSAIYYLHQLGIAHCDLKPENFIFQSKDEDSNIYLIDFGMAKVVQWRQYHKRISGTPYYIAPEVLKGKYNELCDMWSMGIILFVMVFGFPPFHSQHRAGHMLHDKSIFAAIHKGFAAKIKPGYGAWFPQDIPVSKECKDIIARLLRSNPADRLTSEEALDHPWMAKAAGSDDKEADNVIAKSMNAGIYNSLKGFNRDAQAMQRQSMTLQTTVLNILQECKYLNSTQTQDVETFFKAADKNGDGMISEEELYEALKLVDPDISEQDVKSILTAVDASGNGCIDYDELLSSRIARKLQSNEDRMRKVFNLLDFDKSGKISSKELMEALNSTELQDTKLTDEQAQELITKSDKDGDGEIDFEEFIELFKKM